MREFEALTPYFDKLQKRAFTVGAAALVICIAGAFGNRAQFFQSYLLGYLFWIGIPLASIALLALHHMVSGGWGFSIQRILEAAARTLPLLAVLFLPFFWGMQDLYIWARPEVVAADTVLQHKSGYLNIPFFWVRTAGYFGIWIALAYAMTKWSYDHDKSGDDKLLRKIAILRGPAILLVVITVSFSAIDWVMSLEPHWFSTIFGFVFVIGQLLLTISFAVIVLSKIADVKPLAEVVRKKQFHDLGNLMLAFIALWAYISFSEFLIIWSGNLPEEIPWYLHRMHGGWDIVAMALMVFHFVIPFFLLLSRRTKRSIQTLSKVAVAIIVVRFVHLIWIVVPNFHHEHITIHWMDFVALLGLGGLWLGFFVRELRSHALLPQRDIRVKEAFADE